MISSNNKKFEDLGNPNIDTIDEINEIDIEDTDTINYKRVKITGKKKRESINSINEIINSEEIESHTVRELIKTFDKLAPPPPSIEKYNIKKNRIVKKQSIKNMFYCQECQLIFENEDVYNKHLYNHTKIKEEEYCMCQKCLKIFYSDKDFYDHTCDEVQKNNNGDESDMVPENNLGIYQCPSCDKKYLNLFLLGEHFTRKHNDYTELCDLDNSPKYGFPGIDLLYKIGMISDPYKPINESKNKKNLINQCQICRFDYDLNYSKKSSNLQKEIRKPLKLRCCVNFICQDCLTNYTLVTNNVICPFCKKDHTRIDWDYVTYIDIIELTNRENWIPWWERHIDIFN